MTQRATIAGVEVVTIPATDYAALLDCRRQLSELQIRSRNFMNPERGRSPIERDAAVAAFLSDRLGTMTMVKALAECEAEFGPDRTPSHSAVHRYWQRLRVAASKGLLKRRADPS